MHGHVYGHFFRIASHKLQEEESSYISAQIKEQVLQIPDSIDYPFHIKSILFDRCFTCHIADKNAIEGGLSLNTFKTQNSAIKL